MQIDIETRMDIAGEIMERLIEQNLLLTSRVIALENIAAYLIAQQFSGPEPDRDGLARFAGDVGGTALCIASGMQDMPDHLKPVELPQAMERVLFMAEDLFHRRAVSPPPAPDLLKSLTDGRVDNGRRAPGAAV